MKKIPKIIINTSEAEKKFCETVIRKATNDISEAEKKFCKTARRKATYKTYFFNGAWGSGKTSFLKKSEEHLKKRWKVRYLKLWEIRDERSVFELALKGLYPWLNIFVNTLAISSIIISILLTPVINLGLESSLSSTFKIFFVIIALFVAVYKALNLKTDYIYMRILGFLTKWVKRILVIDDFDRVSKENQLESYKLFNVIHGNIPIVFIGDWDKLSDSKDNMLTDRYLSKFVDRKIELPVSLSSYDLSKSYSKEILDTYGGLDPLKRELFEIFLNKCFISDRYSLRELHNFIEYLNDELKEKKGSVQEHQFIIVLYLYVFEHHLYSQLIKNYKISKNITTFDDTMGDSDTNQHFIKDLLFDKYKDTFPQNFSDNPISYFIHDNIRNLSDEEADTIYKELLDNPDSYLSNADKEGEFLLYLKNKNIEESDQDSIVNIILNTIDKDEYFELNKGLYTCVTNSVALKNGPIDTFKQRTFDFWEEKLKDYSVGKKCHIYRKVNVFAHFYDNLKKQAKNYIDSCIQNDNGKIDYPADVAYFLVGGDYENVKESEVDLNKIYEKMNEKDILEFLKYLKIYRQGYILTAFDSSGQTIDLSEILNPILEKFSNLNEILYPPKPRS